jgi:predicted metal-dependent hydrolase
MSEKFFILDNHGEPKKIGVRLSAKAQIMSIRITPKGAELVLPLRVSSEHGYKFLLSKEYWIRQKLRNNVFTETPSDESKVPIFGKLYEVIYTKSDTHSVKLNDNTIELNSTDLVRKKLLQIFLQKKILKEITSIVDIISKKHNLAYKNLKIMNNITRWGYCSSEGSLAFNWRIIFAPYEVLKYLVAHEMSHLKEMNHSKNFWQLIAIIYPEYLPAKLWLKKKGRTLYNYLK